MLIEFQKNFPNSANGLSLTGGMGDKYSCRANETKRETQRGNEMSNAITKSTGTANWVLDRVEVISGREGHGHVFAIAPTGETIVGVVRTQVTSGVKTIEGLRFENEVDGRDAYAAIEESVALASSLG